MTIDLIGFAQIVLFGFPIGDRTVLLSSAFTKSDSDHAPLSLETRSNSNCSYFTSCLVASVLNTVEKFNTPGILLSSGYDSRVVLSVLLHAGVKPVILTFVNRSTTSEQDLASNIAGSLDLHFVACEDKAMDFDTFQYLLSTYLSRSHYVSNPTRLMYFDQLLRSGISIDCLFSGEGETFRFPGYPSEYITENALEVLKYGRQANLKDPEFFTDLPFKQATLEAADLIDSWGNDLSLMDKIHRWLALEAYPKIFGAMAMAFSEYAPVHLPLLDAKFLSAVYNSEYAMRRSKGVKPSIFDVWRSRKAYYSIIIDLAPELLQIPTDRGYPPSFDHDLFKFIPAYLFSKIKSSFIPSFRPFRASKGARSYVENLVKALQTRKLSQFVKKENLGKALDRITEADGRMIHSLSQVLMLSEMEESGFSF